MIEGILSSALSLFVIMGPFASIPVFLSLTKDMKSKQRASAATKAILTAAIVLYAFLFFGQLILEAFMINLASLRIAGGIVLVILGVELMLGIGAERKYPTAITLLATPLLSGPGVIVSTMIFVQQHGYIVTTISAAIALFASWLVLLFSWRISKAIPSYWIDTISRVTGLLLAALAADFVISGIKAAFGA